MCVFRFRVENTLRFRLYLTLSLGPCFRSQFSSLALVFHSQHLSWLFSLVILFYLLLFHLLSTSHVRSRPGVFLCRVLHELSAGVQGAFVCGETKRQRKTEIDGEQRETKAGGEETVHLVSLKFNEGQFASTANTAC